MRFRKTAMSGTRSAKVTTAWPPSPPDSTLSPASLPPSSLPSRGSRLRVAVEVGDAAGLFETHVEKGGRGVSSDRGPNRIQPPGTRQQRCRPGGYRPVLTPRIEVVANPNEAVVVKKGFHFVDLVLVARILRRN